MSSDGDPAARKPPGWSSSPSLAFHRNSAQLNEDPLTLTLRTALLLPPHGCRHCQVTLWDDKGRAGHYELIVGNPRDSLVFVYLRNRLLCRFKSGYRNTAFRAGRQPCDRVLNDDAGREARNIDGLIIRKGDTCICVTICPAN